MGNGSGGLPTTEEYYSDGPGDEGKKQPLLLGAFPKQVAVHIPQTGQRVGREWLYHADIQDGSVSRNHLEFSSLSDRLHVKDLGSRCGTFVNGTRLDVEQPVLLRDGAILRIGHTIFVYREDLLGPPKPLPPLKGAEVQEGSQVGRPGLVAPWGNREVWMKLQGLKKTNSLNVLIEGLTGTGKELLAAVVADKLKPGKKIEPINLAAISHNLLAGQLFGWEKGAFTGGAVENRGHFKSHEGGVVFLDEIEALSLDLQPALLRFLQFREVQKIGANKKSEVKDLVVIAATNEFIAEKIEKKTFRQDLFARFQVRFALQPLKNRPEDVFAIFKALWEFKHGTPLQLKGAPHENEVKAVERMMLYSWPCNVRELEWLVEACDPEKGIELSVVERELQEEPSATSNPNSNQPPPATRQVVKETLENCGGNQTKAAKHLGISRQQIIRLMKKYNLK